MSTFDFLFKIFVPGSLMLIMFGMGLELKLRDFQGLLRDPRALAIGIVGQLLFLPLLGFMLAWLLPMPAEIALGIILLAACPGGVTSNAVVFSSGGDTVLSVSLTAFNSAVCVFTIPFVVGIGLQMFPVADTAVQLDPLATIGKLSVICILPIVAGMVLGLLFPHFVSRSRAFFRHFSSLVLAFLLIVVLVAQWDYFVSNIGQTWQPVLLLTFLSMSAAWLACRALQQSPARTATLVIEIGLQNSNLALLIATTMLHNLKLAIAPSAYGVTSFFIVLVFAIVSSRKIKQLAATAA